MLNIFKSAVAGAVLLASTAGFATAEVSYGYESVKGTKIFYREAGDPSKPSLVLLHGFPSSSHQYRDLIDDLSDAYHVIAPDYPGFGSSDFPSPDQYTYSFDNFADTIDTFLEQRGISKYSLMMHDYGAPVGFRIATEHPERVETLLIKNGNAYEEGINKEVWAPILSLWENPTPELRKTIAENIYSLGGMQWQYTHGTRNPEAILPDNWLLDYYNLTREGMHDVQLDLFYDYRNNVKLYPEWQAYLKENQPPVLVVWGKNDAFFPVSGAEGYKRDVKDIDYNILDTGHFPLEEEGEFIAEKVRTFLIERGIE
ncbi:alpha/beta hydrolase [Amylibacter sp. SFDW26]|uniref:alpha/beta fold hydrolase n=1 Tax=Amylibacter sp. SFDW26 TaxID=2652722 RepID=UPI001261F5C5|nr:alpha/beta hydrolase [Amylibacter sp. SFDW26]KAB7613251.1 alpha/beta hydrolase [Amylibacter sp. SFDW26]